jgi:hypothetical protein
LLTSVNDMRVKIAQLLSRKITLNTFDDQGIIKSGLEAIV